MSNKHRSRWQGGNQQNALLENKTVCEQRHSLSWSVFRPEWTVKGWNLTAHISADKTNPTPRRPSVMWNACKYDYQRNINSRCAVDSLHTVIVKLCYYCAHNDQYRLYRQCDSEHLEQELRRKNIMVHLGKAQPICDILCFCSRFPSAFALSNIMWFRKTPLASQSLDY